MTLMSTDNKIVLAGKEEILLTSGTAYIRIKMEQFENGDLQIRFGIEVEALIETGVNTLDYSYPQFSEAVCKECLKKALESGSPLAGRE